MFFNMIRAHIPKSLRAGVALVVMVVAISMIFNTLSLIIDKPSAGVWLKLALGFVVGIPATICFYMFQAEDGNIKTLEQIQVETLARTGAEKSYQKTTGTPAYPDLDKKPIEPSTSGRPPTPRQQ